MSKNLSLLDFVYLNQKTDFASAQLKDFIKRHGSLEWNIRQHLRLLGEIPKLHKQLGKGTLKNNSTFDILVKTIQEFEGIIDRLIALMFKSGNDLPPAVHGYVRLFDLIDSLDKPDLKDKEKIEQLERDNAGLNNILRISQNKIKTLRKRDNFRLGNLSDTDLELIADGYDPEDTEKIKIDAENYIDSNFEGDFFDNVNANTLIKELGTDIISKDDIESAISSMLDDLCNLFCGFTVMGGEKLYPELGDNPWEHPKTIYLEVSAPDVLLEDLNPDWTEDEYYLVD